MSVQNVVLGQLIDRRGYGYELTERLSDLFDWLELSDAAIYAALRRLEERELIVEVGRDTPRHDRGQHTLRVIFEATEQGRAHYRQWVAEKPRAMPLREPIYLQLMAASEEDIPTLIEGLRQVEAECADKLCRLISSARDERRRASARRSLGAAYVQDGLTAHWEATAAWAQRTRRSLERRVGGSGVPGRRRP